MSFTIASQKTKRLVNLKVLLVPSRRFHKNCFICKWCIWFFNRVCSLGPLARYNSELTSESMELVSIWYSGLEGVSTHRILDACKATNTQRRERTCTENGFERAIQLFQRSKAWRILYRMASSLVKAMRPYSDEVVSNILQKQEEQNYHNM